MTTPEPFDASPDRALGHLLREHLDPGNHDAFVARILAHRPAQVWDVLARWTRAGIAAAAIIGGILALGSRTAERLSATDNLALSDAIAPPSMLSVDSMPVAGGTLTAILEER
jgi:hypothetical protein